MLKEKEIDHLWTRMIVRYGSQWLRMWEAPGDAAVKADWARELAVYSNNLHAIAYGLDNLPPDFPPNVAQFKAICNRRPDKQLPQLPTPPADPARVKQALSGISISSSEISQRANEWRARMYYLRRTGQASRMQLDAIKQFEYKLGCSDPALEVMETEK